MISFGRASTQHTDASPGTYSSANQGLTLPLGDPRMGGSLPAAPSQYAPLDTRYGMLVASSSTPNAMEVTMRKLIARLTRRAQGPSLCKCGCGLPAESRDESAFQLAALCADRLFPGADPCRYRELRALYGY